MLCGLYLAEGFAGILACLGLRCGFAGGLQGQLGGGIDARRLCKLSLCGAVLAQCRGMLAGQHGAKVHLWGALYALGLEAEVRHALIDSGFLKVLVLHVCPQLPDFQQFGFPLCSQLAAAGFLAAALFWVLGVGAFEELVRVAGDPVQRSLAVHDVRVRLLALFDSCLRDVNRVCERVPFANLLLDEVLDQLPPLVGCQLAR